MNFSDLADLARDFKVSKPLFTVNPYGPDGKAIAFVLKERYRPDVTEIKDPVAKLVAEYYDETLDTTRRRYAKRIDVKTVYRTIVRTASDFYKIHAKLKKPTTSLLYKWLDTMDTQYNHPSSEGFIELYRYVHNSGGISSCNKEVVNNVMAILELMKERYER